MCGIFGITGVNSINQLEHCALTLKHRGPDGFGFHYDPLRFVYLAHCRLSIIDLSPKGKQPMCNEDGSLWLTFNGEIYNFESLRRELKDSGHIFFSKTDSEVILHAYEEWGVKCVEKLIGMFAFAIWDSRLGKIFLARDRIGIKPLYYWKHESGFAFASEPKALVDLPSFTREIEYSALFQYLIYGYISGRHSIWKGIKRLLPGHFLFVDIITKDVHEKAYWNLEVKNNEWTSDAAADHLESLLSTSVKEHLVSDVPLAALLSGGMDSSCVVAYAKIFRESFNTLTIGFEGWERDERHLAQLTANILGTLHHEDIVNKDNFSRLKQVFNYFDEPFSNNTMFPMFLVCESASQMAKVMLAGDGGDELFCGYEWYVLTEYCRWIKKAMFFLEPFFKSFGLSSTELGKRCNRLEHYRRMMYGGGFTLQELQALFPKVSPDSFPVSDTILLREHWDPHHGKLKRWQYIDIMTFLVDSILTLTDRCSMANGIEIRVPLLDHRIVEFAFGLSSALLMEGKKSKSMLRMLLKRRGLLHLLSEPKRGFSCPVNLFWDKKDMENEINKGALIDVGILSDKVLNDFIKIQSISKYSNKLFLIAALDQWCQRWYS